MYYLYDNFGRYAGTSETETERSTSIVPPELTNASNWNGYNWVIVADISDVHVSVVQPATAQSVATPPTVSINEFLMLWTREERVKARALRSTDPNLEDIWSRIDDPRTTDINLALASVQEDIEYTLTALKNAEIDIDVDVRKASILAGQLI